jgi:transcriptional regulator with XRE-family HTH domain
MARTPKARALGAALRGAREKSELTTRDLADRIGRNHGEISRWETGDRTPKPEHVAQVLTALGIIGRPYDEIMSLTYDTTAPTWVATSLPAQQQQLATFLDLEQNAAAITEVLPTFVPGLLQTRDYAHALMSSSRLSSDEITTRVAIRMGRRDVITRANPARFTAFMGETALYQNIGEPSVMIEQFQYLLEMARRPNITIRLMPFDRHWHPGLEAPFVFILPVDQTPLVHVELRRSSMFLHEEDMVNAYVDALEMIDKVALRPDVSARIITDRMENLS